MSQIDVFGSETPVEELELGPVQKLLAERARQFLEPLTADEAGAIVHAHRGKHSEETRCAYCAVDGKDALARLRARVPLEEPVAGADSRAGSSSGALSEREPQGREERDSATSPPAPASDVESLAAGVVGGLPRAAPGEASPGSRSLRAFDDDRVGKSHAGGRDTERHAARRVMPNTGTARARVLQLLARAREHGKTDEELSLELGLRLYTAAPRRKELLDDGWIMDSGQRRATSTGCMATVWTLTREARADPRLLQLLRAAA